MCFYIFVESNSMSVDFKTDFSLKNIIPQPANKQTTPEKESQPEDKTSSVKSNTAKDFALGAITASTALVTLGVLARKGKFGKSLQKYLGGAEKEVKNIKPKSPTQTPPTKQNPETVKPASQTAKPENNQLKTEEPKAPKTEEPVQTYTTKLAETIKEYKYEDIDIFGISAGKRFHTAGKTMPQKEMLNKVKNKELTVLYDDKQEITEIILPIGQEFWGVKINGIVSQAKAKDIFRTINANGISDPKQFPAIIKDVLNGKLDTKYSLKNIGMYYDFHDGGAWKFEGGGGKWCADGRIMLRKQNPQWKGYSIAYYAPNGNRSTTEIGVALPSVGMERALSNHYSIFLDGLIPVGTVNRLIKHLETNIIKNPKDVQYEELAKIQEETLKFLNVN